MAFAIVMLLGAPVSGQEKEAEAKKAKAKAAEGEAKKAEAKKGNRGQKRASLAEQTLKRYAALELSDEQKKQIQEIAAEFQPKLTEAQKKYQALVPADQRKARQEAIAKAKSEGKKRAEVVTAFKPTEEQAAAQKQVREVQQAFNAKVNEVLTKEQKQALRKNRQNAEGKKPAGEKKPAAKKTEAKKTEAKAE